MLMRQPSPKSTSRAAAISGETFGAAQLPHAPVPQASPRRRRDRDAELDRNVGHAGVAVHAPQQALHRRKITVELIGKELAVRQHHRPLSDVVTEALYDRGVALNQLTQRAIVRKLHRLILASNPSRR
jgi:hypothetical protein